MKSESKRVNMSGDPTNHRRHPVPGLDGVKLATEASSETNRQASEGRDATVDVQTFKLEKTSIRTQHRIGVWNVRGLLMTGKLTIVEKEMESHNISILGVSETHMRGNGHFSTATGNTMYFSGCEDSSRNGVGIILPPHMNKYVLGYNPVSDRILQIKLNTKPCVVNILQIYAPTAQAKDEVIDDFYGKLEETLDLIPSREIKMILGDWNAKVGSTLADEHIRSTVGKYGLGTRNERGEKLIEFCIDRKLSIMNTFFQHHPRRLYTWKSPGDRHRNQIDYIITDTRWRSSVSKVKTFPGAECGSDHNLLVANFTLRLKAPRRLPPKPRKLEPSEQSTFRVELEAKLKDCLTHEHVSAEVQWNHLKIHIHDTLDQVSKKNRPERKKKCWISDHSWELIQRRKELKTRSLHQRTIKAEYSELNRAIQASCRHDRNSYIEGICSDIERHSHKFQTADLFKKVRVLSKQFKAKSWIIEDVDGTVLHELDQIVERWRAYCEQLYSDSLSSSHTISSWKNLELEPMILRSEISTALRSLKLNKAPGSDQITAELLTSMGDVGVTTLFKICSHVWQNGDWPQDWSESVIIPLHKKGSTKSCSNYRTLSLISHASKVLLHILNNRIRYYLDWQIPQEQAGFVKGKGTREQILNVRQIVEKAYEFDTPVIMCFVDYSKAFDLVNWNHLWRVLHELGVPNHLIALLRTLYGASQGVVRVDKTISKPFKFHQGVRQGCILSPILFNAYGEHIMRRTCENWKGGITVGGVKITNLRYADDTTLLAENESEMVALLNRMERISEEMGLSINRSKTKIMVVDRSGKLELTGALGLETVDNFTYLGSNISNDGSCEKEVRRRIGMAKSAMSQLSKIWRDRNISIKTKTKLVRTLVFSIFSYGAETWTIKAADRKRIDAFEMWCWRRMLRIPWTAFRTNVSILRELKISSRLSSECLRRVLQYFGHIARKDGDNLEKLIVTGKVDGKRPRGRSPIRWSDQIRTALDSTIHNALHTARDRNLWRRITREKVMQ